MNHALVAGKASRMVARVAAMWRGTGVARPLAVCALAVTALQPLAGSRAQALESFTLRAPGASDALMETLRASSLLNTAQETGRTEPADLMAAARAEYGRLLNLLYEDAFFAPTIHIRVDGREASEMSSLTVPARIDRIEVSIDLGPQFTFGTVQIAPLPAGAVLPEGFASGQPARSTVVNEALSAALEAWRALGHAQADVADQQIVANHATRRLDVRLTLVPGPQLRIGSLGARGNERTREERIVEIAGLPSGELLTPETLAVAERRLRETGTFTSVRLRAAERANPDGTMDVTAEVEEALPRRLGFGIEADSEAGFRLSGFWLHRNLLGGAERLRLEASIDGITARSGGIGYTLDARYTRPAAMGPESALELGLRAVRLNERDYDADAIEAEALVTRRLTEALSVGAGLQLRYESADFAGLSADFGTFGAPLDATHDTRDDPLDATRGHYLMAEAMPYLGFASADHGLRLRFDGRVYNDLGTEGRVVLAGRAQLAAILGSDLAATPRGFLFYSGGGGSVRGLPYQSLGVAGAQPSGGRGFAALSGELRVRVTDSLTLAAFADAGHVSDGAFSGPSDWHAGGGFGVRYDTPIGPLRLDLATPLRRNATAAGSDTLQLYLGIGQAF
ncbi:autotransporter assembly complex protein TamA [Pararhodobacter sp.]